MSRYLNILFVCAVSLIVLDFQGQGKGVELAITQGHSDNIEHIAVSENEKYFASISADHELIIWDYQTGYQISQSFISASIISIGFSKNSEEELIIDLKNQKQWRLNTIDMDFKQDSISSFVLSNNVDNGARLKVELDEAKITLLDQNGDKVKSRTSDYFDQPFSSCLVSKSGIIFASCTDGIIYVFDENLKLTKQLKGHNSDVNCLSFSENEKYLFSGSSDRSIIKWNIESLQLEYRYAGQNFALYGISLNEDETKISFGDEVGYVKTIDLLSPSLEIQSKRLSNYPLTQTRSINDEKVVVSGKDNSIYILDKNVNIVSKTKGEKGLFSANHTLFTKGLGLYKESFVDYKSLVLAPSKNTLVTYSEFYNPLKPTHIKIHNIENPKKVRSSPKLFIKNINEATDIFFVNDSVIINAYPKSDGNHILKFWKFNANKLGKIYTKEVLINDQLIQVEKLNDSSLVGISNSHLIKYNLEGEVINKLELTEPQKIRNLNGSMMLVSFIDNSFCLIDFAAGVPLVSDKYEGHTNFITGAVWSEKSQMIYTSSTDGTIRFWKLIVSSPLLTLVPLGENKSIVINSNNYYMTSSNRLSSFGFKKGELFFLPEQFDLKYNRPDKVLSNAPFVDSSLISAYKRAYQKRLRKLNFSGEMLSEDFHIPNIEIININDLKNSQNSDSVTLDLAMIDTKFNLKSVNIWINGVCLFGEKGYSLKNINAPELNKKFTLNLAEGTNNIQVSVVNEAGAESYRKSKIINVESTDRVVNNLYVLAFGTSQYVQSEYNLKFADKDALDFAAIMSKNKYHDQVFTKTILNENFTLESILDARKFLASAGVNDQVMVFVAGHGVLDDNLDYYLATYDMDFQNPADRGLPYSDLEDILDGIKPLKKSLFLDACHSGEIDKEEVELAENSNTETGDIQFRSIGSKVITKDGVPSTELTSNLFLDLRKGTGATVISSAGGLEFAMESNKWKNGLFTYTFIKGITSKKADLNKDGEILLSEIQKYVQAEVLNLSNGLQKPTSRIENVTLDYPIWK
jgi:WD40 repeat protein